MTYAEVVGRGDWLGILMSLCDDPGRSRGWDVVGLGAENYGRAYNNHQGQGAKMNLP